jgi:hypothetical protein
MSIPFFPLLAYSSALRKKAEGYSRTLVMIYQTSWHHIQKTVIFVDGNFFLILEVYHILGNNHTDIVCYQCLLILSHLKLMRSLLATILKKLQTPISVTVHRFGLKEKTNIITGRETRNSVSSIFHVQVTIASCQLVCLLEFKALFILSLQFTLHSQQYLKEKNTGLYST